MGIRIGFTPRTAFSTPGDDSIDNAWKSNDLDIYGSSHVRINPGGNKICFSSKLHASKIQFAAVHVGSGLRPYVYTKEFEAIGAKAYSTSHSSR